MKNRIQSKIAEIEQFWGELEEIIPDDLDTYLTDFQAKAVVSATLRKLLKP